MTMAMSGAIAAISAGSSALANPRTLVFGNSNGVSFGLSGSTITASAAGGGGGGEFLSFSNANNVTFGKAGSTITASASFSQSVQPQSAFVFSDGGGISFGTNGSTVTASHNGLTTAAQSNHVHGQYLTTAALSDHVHGQYLTTAMASNAGATAGNTFANSTHSHGAVATTNISVTSASNGLSLSVAAQSVQTQSRFNATLSGNTAGVMAQVSSGVLTLAGGNNITLSQNGNAVTISGANAGGAQTGISGLSAGTTQMTSGTAVFSNSNGISFGANGNTITASHNGLTTAAQSNHSHGNPTLALTNLSGTTASNSNGLTLSLSAAAGGGGADGYNILAAGTQTATTAGSVLFSNENGISFGMSGSTRITASHNALTTARASNDAIGLNTAATNVTWTVGSGGLSLNAGAYLTTAMASNAGSNFVGLNSALTGNGVLATINSSGISLSVPAFLTTAANSTHTHAGYLTTARASNDAIGLNTALTANGVSMSANSSGLSLHFPAFLTTAQPPGAYLTTAALSDHVHGQYLTTAAQSGHSHGVTLNLTNLNGTTGGNSAGINLSLSAIVPAQTVQPVAVSAANGSYNFSTLTLANSGGVSFSTGTQGVYATVATNYAASNITTNNIATANSSLFQHTTATSAITAAAFPAANSTQLLGTSFSSHSHGNPSLNLTNISGTTASGSGGFTLSLSAAAPVGGGGAALSAGTQSVSTGTVAFANSNGISFGMSGSNQITASYTVPTIPGATSFSNSNNVSFGLNGSTITATATFAQSVQTQGMVSFNGQTGALSRAVGSSLSSSVNGVSTTLGLASNITTALQSAGAYLTTAMASNASSAFAGTGSGFTGGSISATLTHNTLGLSMSMSHPAWLTTAMQSGMTSNYMSTAERGNYFYTSNNTFANSTHSHGNPTLNLTNLSGTTASGSAGLTLSLSAAAPGGGGAVNVSAGTTSGNLQTIQFNNSNGVSFGLSGSTITASAAAGAGGGVAIQNSQTTYTSGTVALSVGGGALTIASNTGQRFDLSVPATSSLSGINLTITPNGNTITISAAAAGGGGHTGSAYIPYYPASTGNQTMGATGTSTASAFFWPLSIVGNVAINRIEQLMTCSWISSSVSGQQTISHLFGLFSNNAGTLSSIRSGSYSLAMTGSGASATLSFPSTHGTAGGYTYTTATATATAAAQSLWGTAGNRIMTFGFSSAVTLTEGLYWLGFLQRMSSSSANIGLVPALAGNIMGAAQSAGPIGSSTAAFTVGANASFKWGWGVASSTGSAGYSGTALPASMPMSAIANTFTIMPMCTLISR